MAIENNRSNFEESLFSGGAFTVDVTTYLLSKSRPELHAPYLPWLNKFSGMIPNRWEEHWGNILGDFEEAGKRRVQLSSTLVDAGVWHPHWLVVTAVVHTQRLTPEQMAIALSAHLGFKDELPNAQRALGVTEEDILEAKIIFFDRTLWERYLGFSEIPVAATPFQLK